MNESFNNTVISKHPKNVFYGGSESHCIRVATAVCQKNFGYSFAVSINKKLHLSSWQFTVDFRKQKKYTSYREIERKNSIPIKKRRLILKKDKSFKNVAVSNREDLSYQSGCGYLNTSDLIDETFLNGNYQIIV